MIEFFSISIFSFFSIVSLAKILNFYGKYNYFISIVFLTFLSFLCLLFNLNLILLFTKLILVIFFVYSLAVKKISINKIDLFYILIFIFLIYFNYGDRFYKEDAINGYGYQIKSIFINNGLPHFNNITNFDNYNLDILSSIYFNFFTSGSINFREDVVILSQNLFLIISVFIILNPLDFINKNKIINVTKLVLIFYFLTAIFFQNGKNVFAEDILICFIFGLTIFLLENHKINNLKYFSLILMSFFLIGLGKKAAVFLVIFPLLIILFNFRQYPKNFIYFLFFCCAIFLSINFNYYISTKSEIHLTEKREHIRNLNIEGIINLKNDNHKIKKFEGFSIHEFTKIPGFTKNLAIRYKFYKQEPELFLERLKIYNKKVFNIEVYKASLFPTVRYILKNKFDVDFPRISIKLTYWFLLIFLLGIYLKLNSKKNSFTQLEYKKIFLFLFIIIFMNVLLVYEDLFRHGEMINHTENIYTLKDEYTNRDTSRYLGWSIMFSLLLFIYMAKKFIKKNYSKFLNIILISLILIVPARSFGYILKINLDSKILYNVDKQYKKFERKFNNSCRSNDNILIFDYDSKRLSFNYFYYKFYLNKFVPMTIYKNQEVKVIKIIDEKIFKNKKNNIKCIIVPSKSKISEFIKTNYKFKNFKVAPFNEKELNFVNYVIY